MKEIEEKLRSRLAELTSRAGQIASDMRQEDGALSRDWEEQAIDLENSEVLAAMDTKVRAEIEQIQGALTRLKNGTFGVCAVCQERIPDKRLHALPYTTRCVNCA